MLTLRRPDGKISTPRREKDEYKIVSGALENVTTGTPITILIPNENVRSGDYSAMKTLPAPHMLIIRQSASTTAIRTLVEADISAAVSRRLSLPQVLSANALLKKREYI